MVPHPWTGIWRVTSRYCACVLPACMPVEKSDMGMEASGPSKRRTKWLKELPAFGLPFGPSSGELKRQQRAVDVGTPPPPHGPSRDCSSPLPIACPVGLALQWDNGGRGGCKQLRLQQGMLHGNFLWVPTPAIRIQCGITAQGSTNP